MGDVATDDIMAMVFTADLALPSTNVVIDGYSEKHHHTESHVTTHFETSHVESHHHVVHESHSETILHKGGAHHEDSFTRVQSVTLTNGHVNGHAEHEGDWKHDSSKRSSVQSGLTLESEVTSVNEYNVNHNGNDSDSDKTDIVPVKSPEHDEVLKELKGLQHHDDHHHHHDEHHHHHDHHDEYYEEHTIGEESDPIDIDRESEFHRIREESVLAEHMKKVADELHHQQVRHAHDDDSSSDDGVVTVRTTHLKFDDGAHVESTQEFPRKTKRDSLDLYTHQQGTKRVLQDFPQTHYSVYEEAEYETPEYVEDLNRNSTHHDHHHHHHHHDHDTRYGRDDVVELDYGAPVIGGAIDSLVIGNVHVNHQPKIRDTFKPVLPTTEPPHEDEHHHHHHHDEHHHHDDHHHDHHHDDHHHDDHHHHHDDHHHEHHEEHHHHIEPPVIVRRQTLEKQHEHPHHHHHHHHHKDVHIRTSPFDRVESPVQPYNEVLREELNFHSGVRDKMRMFESLEASKEAPLPKGPPPPKALFGELVDSDSEEDEHHHHHDHHHHHHHEDHEHHDHHHHHGGLVHHLSHEVETRHVHVEPIVIPPVVHHREVINTAPPLPVESHLHDHHIGSVVPLKREVQEIVYDEVHEDHHHHDHHHDHHDHHHDHHDHHHDHHDLHHDHHHELAETPAEVHLHHVHPVHHHESHVELPPVHLHHTEEHHHHTTHVAEEHHHHHHHHEEHHNDSTESQQPVSALLSIFGGGKKKGYEKKEHHEHHEHHDHHLHHEHQHHDDHHHHEPHHDHHHEHEHHELHHHHVEPTKPVEVRRQSVTRTVIGSAVPVEVRRQSFTTPVVGSGVQVKRGSVASSIGGGVAPPQHLHLSPFDPLPQPPRQERVATGYSYNPMTSPSFNPNYNDPKKFESVRIVRNVREFVKTWGQSDFVAPVRTPLSPTVAVWHEAPARRQSLAPLQSVSEQDEHHHHDHHEHHEHHDHDHHHHHVDEHHHHHEPHHEEHHDEVHHHHHHKHHKHHAHQNDQHHLHHRQSIIDEHHHHENIAHVKSAAHVCCEHCYHCDSCHHQKAHHRQQLQHHIDHTVQESLPPAFQEYRPTEVRAEVKLTTQLVPVKDRRSLYEANAGYSVRKPHEGIPPMVNLLD